MWKDFFFNLDESIVETNGSIFQFVGDEVVILWKTKEGVENNNCLRFFFLAEDNIKRYKEKFSDKYGVYPEFKAGLHFGNVIVTEVGGTKQEIAYHGDTVNTAALPCIDYYSRWWNWIGPLRTLSTTDIIWAPCLLKSLRIW